MDRQIKELLGDILKYLPSQITPAIIGLFSIPIVTRLFPPSDFGNYVLVLATVSILNAFVGWISTSIIRFYPAHERDSKLAEFYSTTVTYLFASVAILAIMFVVIVVIFKRNISPGLYNLMLIGVVTFIMSALFQAFQDLLRVRRALQWYTLFSIWNSIGYLGIGLLLILGFGAGIEGLLLGSVVSLGVMLPLLWKFSSQKNSLKIGAISTSLAKEMATYGFPLVIGSLAAWVLSVSDRYVLEFFRGSHEVGIYSASYVISEKTMFLINALFSLAGGPIGVKMWESGDRSRITEFVKEQTRYYLIISIPAGVGLSVLAKPIIELLTAKEYYECYRIVPFVVFSAVCLGLQHRFQWGLVFLKKTSLVMVCIVLSGLLNIGSNMVLVPKYGYMAAGITTFSCYGFLLILMIFMSRRFFEWSFPFRTLVTVCFASSIMGISVYYLTHYLRSNLGFSTVFQIVLCVCFGTVWYFILLFLFGEMKSTAIGEVLGLKKSRILW